jgi:ribosomal protein RSM22 (predicted rRNA methylase)
VPPAEFAPVFGVLPVEVRNLLESFPDIVDAVFPLDSKKKLTLPQEIRDLSHELTDERGDRRVGYMNEPAVISAYIRYYMWWNLVRLTRMFVTLPVTLADGDVAVDLGSGPLTLPIALWMSRPDLRDKKITWYCVDISQGALAAGEELFLSLAARTGNEPWQIIRVKGECGVSLRRRVALVTSANMFNELFQDNPLPLEAQAKHYAEEISSYAGNDSAVLIIEPGVPRAGRFISLLRDALLRLDYVPESPCPHAGVCPFPGLRNGKWCHFVFDTEDAPVKLHKLSEEAGLAKDRAALSFVYSRRKPKSVVTSSVFPENDIQSAVTLSPVDVVARMAGLFPNLKVRITSDPIRLPDFYTGRYGCSELGMVLVSGTYQAADYLKECNSGSLIEVPRPERKNPDRDPKTDAIVIRLK